MHPRRRYNSERRREQADQTRALVLAAAAELFEERGYQGTSIAAVAAQARVSPETVYAHFGNKRALLGELVRRAVRGDETVPVPEQKGPRAIAAATDQHEQLRIFAADIVPRLERAAPLVAVVAGASRSDPELAQLLTTLHTDRLKNLRTLTRALAANGPLRLERGGGYRDGLGVDQPGTAPAPRAPPRLVEAPLPRLARRKSRRASPPVGRLGCETAGLVTGGAEALPEESGLQSPAPADRDTTRALPFFGGYSSASLRHRPRAELTRSRESRKEG